MYRCIKELIVDTFNDDNEVIENSPISVKEGSEWNIEHYRYQENDIRLINENAEWIEIGKRTFKEHFQEVM